LCRAFGNCLCGDELDMEIGDLVDNSGSMSRPVTSPLFTYVRYNAELTRKGLDKFGLNNIEPKDVHKLDSVKHIKKLQRVGRAVASKQVVASHFRGFT
jgi:hypothetical protein